MISDTTTNDAIELTGDGASLVGYQESGLGTVAHPDTAGYIGCGIAGCTVVKNPNQATSKINYVHLFGMYLQSNGASSKVIDMTSIGHSDIENNNFQLGTGGNSYGVYGNSSVGGFDGSNTIFKHNNFQPETTGDACFYLAGNVQRRGAGTERLRVASRCFDGLHVCERHQRQLPEQRRGVWK